MHYFVFQHHHKLLYYAWNRICLLARKEVKVSGPKCLKRINIKILDGLASKTPEPHMYTAAVSLARGSVVSFAAWAYYISLLIYYDCFLITI